MKTKYVIQAYYKIYDTPANLRNENLNHYTYKSFKLSDLPAWRDPKFSVIRSFYEDCIVGAGAHQSTYIAGSSVAAMFGDFDYSDIDVFFDTPVTFSAVLTRMSQIADRLETTITKPDLSDCRTVDFIYGGKRIQLVKTVWYNSLQHLFNSFDFSVTKFAIKDGTCTTTSTALEDINSRILNFDGKCGSSARLMYRLIKYIRKGYKVPGETINSIVKHIAANPTATDDAGSY